MMRAITIAVTVVGVAAGATAIAINLDVFVPAAPTPIVVTPPSVEDPASAELLKRMDEDRARIKAAEEADQNALERRLGKVGKPQHDPTKW
jgi:hypothetical protein